MLSSHPTRNECLVHISRGINAQFTSHEGLMLCFQSSRAHRERQVQDSGSRTPPCRFIPHNGLDEIMLSFQKWLGSSLKRRDRHALGHPGDNPGANFKSISHRCHSIVCWSDGVECGLMAWSDGVSDGVSDGLGCRKVSWC